MYIICILHMQTSADKVYHKCKTQYELNTLYNNLFFWYYQIIIFF